MARKISRLRRIRGDTKKESIADKALTLMARVRIFRSNMSAFIRDAKPILVKNPSIFNESELDFAELTLTRLDELNSEYSPLLKQVVLVRDKIETVVLNTSRQIQDYRDGSQPEKLHALEGKLVFMEDMLGQLSQAVSDLNSISNGLSALVAKLRAHWEAILKAVIKKTSPSIPVWADEVIHHSIVALHEKMVLYASGVQRIKTYMQESVTLPESSRKSVMHELRTAASKIAAEINSMSASSASKVMMTIIGRQFAKYIKPMQTHLIEELTKMKTSDLTARMESELTSMTDRYGVVMPVTAPMFGSSDVTVPDGIMKKIEILPPDIMSSVYTELRNAIHIALMEWIPSNVYIVEQIVNDSEFSSNINKALSTADARRRTTLDGAHVLLDRDDIIRKDIEQFIPPGSFENMYSQIDRACKLGDSPSLDCIHMALVLVFMKYIPSSHFMWHTLNGHRVVTTRNLQLMYPEALTLISSRSSARDMLVKSFWELVSNVINYHVLRVQLSSSFISSHNLADQVHKTSDLMYINVENISAIRRRAKITGNSVPNGLMDIGIRSGNYVVHSTADGTECLNWKLVLDRMTEPSATRDSIMINIVNRSNPFSPEWIAFFAQYFTSTDSDEELIRIVLSGNSLDFTEEELFGSDADE